MANGAKRNKIRKMMSPSSTANTPPEPLAADDDELMDDLFAELDNRSPTVQAEAAQVINEVDATNKDAQQSSGRNGKSSKMRFQEREARKAEALAAVQPATDPEAEARLEREAQEEEAAINKICKSLGLEMFEIPPDGHCLFSAIADQLYVLGIVEKKNATYQYVRETAALYMSTYSADFIPFLPSLDGEDGVGATDATGIMNDNVFETYCASIRDTAVWGGELEIMALSRAFKIPIHVVQSGPQSIVVHSPNPDATEDTKGPIVRISYHRRMYGLGEHYNSLRPKISHKVANLF